MKKLTAYDNAARGCASCCLRCPPTIGYTLYYVRRVKADPSKPLTEIGEEDRALAAADAKAPEPLTTTHAIVIGLVFFTFGLLAFSIVPWGALLNSVSVDPYTDTTLNSPLWWELGWWLPELSALFFVMAIAVGIAGRLGEEAAAKAFIRGLTDFTGPAFLVTLARSVSVVMTNTKTIDRYRAARDGRTADRRLERDIRHADVPAACAVVSCRRQSRRRRTHDARARAPRRFRRR
jgi:uncharacterized ion transporter superfamily protein YfcC